ncbi:MAG: hypothetical protein E7272_12695 [Pseudobutyrivibrio ruminis]|uniref:Uncharacterized protein n=1 Tax=Pseudobutyrivibrio ruminis TaxID=46206 RepID=A0A927UF35_9FIRM|nr:hypothetical protein [Pseudobutyrivibrio ruminis]
MYIIIEGAIITVGGIALARGFVKSPLSIRKRVMLMVSYGDLFTYTLVLIGVITLVYNMTKKK